MQPIRSISFFDIFPKASSESVILENLNMTLGNVSIEEEYYLANIVKIIQPSTIFEFGTFNGRTTLQLALNATDAKIYTLDLPPNSLNFTTYRVSKYDSECASKRPNFYVFSNHLCR